MALRYFDRQDHPAYGSKLIIYRRSEDKTKSFTFRAKIDGVPDYVRRSTGTSDPVEAMLKAQTAYVDLLVKHQGGFSLSEITVDKYFYGWLDRKQHHFTDSRLKWKKSVYERYISEFMGNKVLSNLNKTVVDDYWDFRLNYWKDPKRQKRIESNEKRARAKGVSSKNIAINPSFATLRAEASLINEFLRAATDEGQLSRTIKISAQDAIPKNLRGSSYRDTFTDHEWNVLTTNLFNYAEARGKWAGRINSSHRFQRKMLRAFVLLSASTGLRVGEQKQLNWGDLHIQKNDKGEDILVISVRDETSKVKRGRTAVAYSSHTLGVMEEFKEISPLTKPGDFIFGYVKRDGSANPADVSKSFKTFLEKVDYEGRERGLLLSSQGKPRTLYSLRHFYAIQRLKQNVDVFRLATNMGTGVQQIRNHYGRHISGDAFINELTKFQSKTADKTKEQAVRSLMDMVQTGVIDPEIALEQIKKVAELQ